VRRTSRSATLSGTPPPTARHPHPQKQADTGEATDQNGCHGGAETSHGDRGSNRESDKPANERPTAIRGRQPLQLGEDDNCGPDADDASDDRPCEEPGLPCGAAKDGTDHGTQARQRPSSNEYGYGLQGFLAGYRKSCVCLTLIRQNSLLPQDSQSSAIGGDALIAPIAPVSSRLAGWLRLQFNHRDSAMNASLRQALGATYS
jgi:hypothetical protein